MVYYKLGRKTTPVNYFGLAKLPTFRNGDTAVTAGLLLGIDRCDAEVQYSEPTPKIEETHHDISSYYTDVVGYDQGNLVIPEHYVKSGKWWYYVVGSCTTVSNTYETHTFNEAGSQPYLGLHCEMEHETTAYNKMVDLLGVTIESARFSWSQDRPAMQSFTCTVSKGKSAGNLARDTSLDFKKNFMPGKFSAVLEYAGTSLNFTIRDGSINYTKTFEYGKAADELVTEANLMSRDYEINLGGLASKNTVFTVPDEPNDYSSNCITLDIKFIKGASTTGDNIRFSFNNLRLDKVMGVKIADSDYYWKGNLLFHNCGARTGVTAGKCVMTVIDDLTKNHYER